jgi:hypothetical protein
MLARLSTTEVEWVMCHVSLVLAMLVMLVMAVMEAAKKVIRGRDGDCN